MSLVSIAPWMTEPVVFHSRRFEKHSMRGSVSPELSGCSVYHPGPSIKAHLVTRLSIPVVPHSQTLLRIYDKRLERQAKEHEDWQDYGIRWELELKKNRAQTCGQVLSFLEEADWLEYIVGVLRSYVDFRDTNREEADMHRCRTLLLDWWLLLTEGFKKAQLVVEKDPQTLAKAKLWVSRSVVPDVTGKP
jgi:hypothetical protein